MIALEKGLPPDHVHERVLQAHRDRRAAERTLAFYLKEIRDRGLHEVLGYASIQNYARAVADLSGRQTRDLLRVADAPETLPRLAQAYADARLSSSSVREITRVATPETEDAWIAEASALSCRAVEALVARSRPGDSPAQARGRRAGEGIGREFVNLLLQVRPETKAVFEKALADALRATEARSLDEALLFMAERMAAKTEAEEGDPTETNRPPYQVVLHRCEACRATTVGPDGPPAPASLEAKAECDAETVDLGNGGKATKMIPPRIRRSVLMRDAFRCQAPYCKNRLWLDVHHIVPRAAGGGHGTDNLATTCSRHHGLVHEGKLRVVRGAGGELRWFNRYGWEIGRGAGRATHVGRLAGEVDGGPVECATRVATPIAMGVGAWAAPGTG